MQATSNIPVTRLAPSPTGRMHAGNVFAALVTWLLARSQGGRVLLRIEDVDTGRARPRFAVQILDDLEWLGLTWDGPVVYQSQRTELYLDALERLDARGLLYPCFCTRADLHAADAPHAADGTVVYPGTCRDLTAEQVARKSAQHAPALRLKVPPAGDPAGIVTFHDQLQGDVECELAVSVGDYLVRRSDGLFAYQLAVVVDDLCQGVNLLVRGCDLLPSTPQQLYLRRLLRQAGMCADVVTEGPEAFYHLPLMVNPEGKRLSKRDGSCDMGTLRNTYRTPEALLGHLAHVTGIVPGPEQPLSAQQMLPLFSLEPLKCRWTV